MSKYETLWDRISKAYQAYGGFSDFVASPFLHLAVLLSLICAPLLVTEEWVGFVISISPSLLGFTLAGYTIFISSLSPELTVALTRAKDGAYSVYRKINVTFFHFIFVQVVSIIFAITFTSVTSFSLPSLLSDFGILAPSLASKMDFVGYYLLGFLGQSLLFYSVASVVAIIVWIYRIITIVEGAQKP